MDFERITWLLVVIIIGCVPLGAYVLRVSIVLSAAAAERAGKLLLAAPRPRTTRVNIVFIVIISVIFIVELATCIYQIVAAPPLRANSLLSAFMWAFILCTPIASIGLPGAWAGAPVEFREHGILSNTVLWPWDQIREWGWTERGSTLFVKTGHAVLNFQLRPGDKEAVEAILRDHVVLTQVPG
jgi:hypothetical protein